MIDLDFTCRFIAGFEGFVGDVYLDSAGVETIGYGETSRDVIERYRSTGISQADALALLGRRVQGFADEVEACITNKGDLTPNRHAALTSFTYNIGVGALQESTLLKRFNAGDMDAVPGELSRWDKAGGQTLAGLTRRRTAEGDLFRGAGGGGGAPPPKQPPTLASGAGAPPWPGRLLANPTAGDDVRTMQQRLADRGWAIKVDAEFGPKTATVVEKFQTEKGLTVDRIVGPTTWAALWAAPVT